MRKTYNLTKMPIFFFDMMSFISKKISILYGPWPVLYLNFEPLSLPLFVTGALAKVPHKD